MDAGDIEKNVMDLAHQDLLNLSNVSFAASVTVLLGAWTVSADIVVKSALAGAGGGVLFALGRSLRQDARTIRSELWALAEQGRLRE